MIGLEELFCIGIAIVAFAFLIYFISNPPDPPTSCGGRSGQPIAPVTKMVMMDVI